MRPSPTQEATRSSIPGGQAGSFPIATAHESGPNRTRSPCRSTADDPTSGRPFSVEPHSDPRSETSTRLPQRSMAACRRPTSDPAAATGTPRHDRSGSNRLARRSRSLAAGPIPEQTPRPARRTALSGPSSGGSIGSAGSTLVLVVLSGRSGSVSAARIESGSGRGPGRWGHGPPRPADASSRWIDTDRLRPGQRGRYRQPASAGRKS